MRFDPDRLLSQRRELKYLVSHSVAKALSAYIAPFMRPDPYTAGREGGGYPIASLYLDSPAMSLCRQTMAGEKNRFKLRVRSYSDDPGERVYFEIKRRVDQIVLKRRAAVERAAARLYFDSGRMPSAADANRSEVLADFASLVREHSAGPVARVGYRREAYESMSGEPLRMTFDRGLRYRMTEEGGFGLNGPGWKPALLRGVIFEIKFTGAYPGWLDRMTREFSLQARSIPKYVISISRAERLPDSGFHWDGRL